MKYLFIILFILSSFLSTAQEKPINWGEVSFRNASMTSLKEFPESSAVILRDYCLMEVNYERGSSVTSYLRYKKTKVLTSEGVDPNSNVGIVYYAEDGYEFIRGLKAQTLVPNGKGGYKTVKLSKTDFFKEELPDGFKRIRFTFPAVTEGAILEYQYERVTAAITTPRPWYFQNELPTLWSEVRFKIPKYYDYSTLSRTLKPFKFDKSQDVVYYFGDQDVEGVVFMVAMDSMPPLKEEPYITTKEDFRQRIEFQLALVKHPQGGVDTVMTNWPNFADEILKNKFIGDQLTKNFHHRKLELASAELQEQIKTSEQPVADIYDFVQSKVEWNGELSIYADKSLDKALAAGKAYSGEMNLIFIKLLRDAGYEASPVLISTRKHGKVKKVYPIARQFNHLITAAKIDGNWKLFDVSNTTYPMGILPDYCLNDEGMMLSEKGPAWIEIGASLSSERTALSIEFDEENIKWKEQSMFTNYDARLEWKELEEIGEDDYFNQLTEENNTLESKKLLTQNENLARFGYEVEYTKEEDMDVDILYIDPLLGNTLEDNPFDAEKRYLPVDFAYPIKREFIVSMKLPENATVEEIPESIRITLPEDEGSYEYQIAQNGQLLQLRTRLLINKTYFAPGEYYKLKELFDYMIEKQNELIVLKMNN